MISRTIGKFLIIIRIGKFLLLFLKLVSFTEYYNW